MPIRLPSGPGRARTLRRLAATLAVALALPAASQAQVADTTLAEDSAVVGAQRVFEVSAVTGYQWFDKSSAVRHAPMFGVRILNPRILPAVPGLTLGFSAGVARPTTRGDYFPWNRQIYYSDINRRNDTTLVYEVSQRLTMATYGAEVGYRFGGGEAAAGLLGGIRAAALDVSAGIGGYAFWEDPEQNRANEVHSKLAYSLGAGVGVPVAGNAFIRLRADDHIFTGYDREWFSIHDPLFSEELFGHLQRTPPEAKRTIHNLRLSVQFSFYPGAER